MRPTETITSDGENVTVTKSVDAEPIMEAMKDYGDIIDKKKTGAAGAKLVGSIDPITAAIWRKECGAGIGTREFAKYAMKKLADPDFRRFRLGGF